MEVEHKIEASLQTLDSYNKSKVFRTKILQGDQATMNAVQFVVAQILRQPIGDPTQKMLAIKFCKDCIETFNDDFISQFQVTVLPLMEKIALFDKKNPDEDRGKLFFSPEPDENLQKIGNTFFRLVLECLWVWSKWFPIDPDSQLMSLYKLAVQRLVFQGVKFVKLEYFRAEDVFRFLPEQQVPLKILNESKRAIREDFLKTGNEGSNLKILQGKLYIDLRKGMVHDDDTPVFLQDKIKKAFKKYTKEKRKASIRVELKQSEKPVQESRIERSPVAGSIYPNAQTDNLATSAYMPIYSDQPSQHLNHTIRQLQREIVELVKENKNLRQNLYNRDGELNALRQKLDSQIVLNQRLEADNRTLQQHLNYNQQLQGSHQGGRYERSRFEAAGKSAKYQQS